MLAPIWQQVLEARGLSVRAQDDAADFVSLIAGGEMTDLCGVDEENVFTLMPTCSCYAQETYAVPVSRNTELILAVGEEDKRVTVPDLLLAAMESADVTDSADKCPKCVRKVL